MLRTVSSSCFLRSVHVEDASGRFWYLQFCQRPKPINGTKTVESVDFEQTEPVPTSHFADENLSVRGNGIVESIPWGLVIKSIGYSDIQVSIANASNGFSSTVEWLVALDQSLVTVRQTTWCYSQTAEPCTRSTWYLLHRLDWTKSSRCDRWNNHRIQDNHLSSSDLHGFSL